MNDRQIQHELEMSRQATVKLRELFRTALDKNYASNTEFGRTFLKAYALPFASALQEAIVKVKSLKATNTARARGYKLMERVFTFVDPHVVSCISIKTLFDNYLTTKGNQPKVISGIKKVGKRIRDQHQVQYYTVLAPEDVVGAQRKELTTKGSGLRNRLQGAKQVVEKLLLNVHEWDEDDLFQDYTDNEIFAIGHFVLDVADEFGILEKYKIKTGSKKTPYGYKLTQQIEAQLIRFNKELEELSILTWPLVAIPKEWKVQPGASRDNYSGGYYHEWIRRDRSLCRSPISESHFGSDAINLLNTLGRTAWNINSDICDLANECLSEGKELAKLNVVFYDPILDQNMPDHLTTRDKKDPERKDWVKLKAHLYETRQISIDKARRTISATSIANQFRSKSRFYLSWSCDYRGRMYSQQSLLHQASTDFERSLVTFADGCKLDKAGESWAATALGAAFVGDKVPYAERAQWTYENKELIKAIAEDPISMKRQWESQADTPWQFLQLVKEWNRVVLTNEKALWDVPISSDSTASGLQLLSGMRRDPKGMEFSNLLPPVNPDAPPKDAYLEVLRIAKELAEKDPDKHWMLVYLDRATFKEARQIGKQVLMKMVYGATRQTNISDIKKVLFKASVFPDLLNYQSVVAITELIRAASEKAFPMAYEALAFIKKLSDQAKKNGITCRQWTTPTLDSIHLIEQKYETIRIESAFLGRISIPTNEPIKPDHPSMKSALAPGFVHSYDAALLKSAFQDWHHPIAVIHDCLKVLPNDMDRAKERIRNGFVHVCSGDPLARLADDLGVSAEQLPRLEQGSGDLNSVLNSAYMFN